MHLLLLFITLFSSQRLHAEFFYEPDFVASSASLHHVEILNHGLGSLEKRIQLVEKAKKSIDVEYYIFKLDLSSQILTQALLKKARQGVRVRILIDYFANRKSPNPHILPLMKEFGIEVKFFNTTPFYNLREVQYRNHRKALIIDQETAVVGGRNVADEYFDLSPTYNYLDRDMAIHGEIVGSISRTFEANFNSQWATHIKLPKKPSEDDPRYHRQDYDSDLFARELKRWNKNQNNALQFLEVNPDISAIRELGQKSLSHSIKGTCNKLQFLSEIPGFGRKKKYGRILKNLIREKIESAQSNIIIESPYFVVTDEFREVLDKAFDSQVNIKLLTNSLNSTDHVFVFSAFESELYGMMNKYLDTYVVTGQRPDGYEVLDQVQNSFYGIHSKTFVFDDKDFIISTFNFDPRSSDINSELLILCEDSPELALKIRDNVRERTKESFHVESSDDLYDATYKKGKLKKIIFSLISKIPAKVFRFLL